MLLARRTLANAHLCVTSSLDRPCTMYCTAVLQLTSFCMEILEGGSTCFQVGDLMPARVLNQQQCICAIGLGDKGGVVPADTGRMKGQEATTVFGLGISCASEAHTVLVGVDSLSSGVGLAFNSARALIIVSHTQLRSVVGTD